MLQGARVDSKIKGGIRVIVSHAEADRRLLRLDALARLRRLGWWPWCALVGWSLIAVGQEPFLLRSFGTNLCSQAAWSGAAILLVLVILVNPATPTGRLRHTVNISLLLVGSVGLVQAIVAYLSDQLLGVGHSLGDAGRSCLLFVLVWTPASLGLCCPDPDALRPALARLLRALPFGFSLAMAACWRDGPSPAVVASSGLAALGVILATARSKPLHAARTSCA